nr:hypothetical protein [Cobetia crustatorum]
MVQGLPLNSAGFDSFLHERIKLRGNRGFVIETLSMTKQAAL